jgi:hypothetical protein
VVTNRSCRFLTDDMALYLVRNHHTGAAAKIRSTNHVTSCIIVSQPIPSGQLCYFDYIPNRADAIEEKYGAPV